MTLRGGINFTRWVHWEVFSHWRPHLCKRAKHQRNAQVSRRSSGYNVCWAIPIGLFAFSYAIDAKQYHVLKPLEIKTDME